MYLLMIDYIFLIDNEAKGLFIAENNTLIAVEPLAESLWQAVPRLRVSPSVLEYP